MFIGFAKLSFACAHGGRKALARRLVDKLRNKLNVSVAEVEPNEGGDTVTLGVSVVAQARAHCQSQLDKLLDIAHTLDDAQLRDEYHDVLSLSEASAIGEPTLADREGLKRDFGGARDAEANKREAFLADLRKRRAERGE